MITIRSEGEKLIIKLSGSEHQSKESLDRETKMVALLTAQKNSSFEPKFEQEYTVAEDADTNLLLNTYQLDLSILRTLAKKCAPQELSIVLDNAAMQYEQGGERYKKGNYKEALQLFVSSAIQRNTNALAYMAFMHNKGQGVTQSSRNAAELYKLAADRGNPHAQLNLVILYCTEEAMQENSQEAIREAVRWFESCKDKCPAQKLKSAITESIKPAAAKGSVIAQVIMGFANLEGVGIEKNDKEAAKWFESAARQGNLLARDELYKLGNKLEDKYYKGDEIEEDVAEVFRLSTLAADLGHPTAQYKAGCYFRDQRRVENGALKKAFDYFKLSADQGHLEALCNLGFAYSFGMGVKKDEAQAFKCFHAAAYMGDVPAMHNVGRAYQRGAGVERNYQEAAKYYKLAVEKLLAEKKIAQVQNSLNLYTEGKTLLVQGEASKDNDPQGAAKLFESATEQFQSAFFSLTNLQPVVSLYQEVTNSPVAQLGLAFIDAIAKKSAAPFAQETNSSHPFWQQSGSNQNSAVPAADAASSPASHTENTESTKKSSDQNGADAAATFSAPGSSPSTPT